MAAGRRSPPTATLRVTGAARARLRVVATARRGALALAAAAAGAAAALSLSVPEPFPQRPVVDFYFGTPVVDPYRDLENLEDPAVAAWMKAQAEHTRTQLDLVPGRAALLARITELDRAVAARVVNVQRRPGGLHFYEKREAADNQFKLVVRRGTAGPERVLVDPEEAQRRTGAPHAISWFEASRSGRYVAYGLAASGSEDASLYVVEVESGRTVMGPVSRAQFGGVAWLPDDSGFFFNRLQTLAPGAPEAEKYQKSRALLVRLGADPERARSVLAFDTPGVTIDPAVEFPYVFVQANGQHALGVVFHGTDREFTLLAAPLADVVRGGPVRWRTVFTRADAVTAFEVVGDRLFVLTHRGAPRFRLLETSLARPDLAAAREVMPEGPGVLTALARGADGLYIARRDGTVSRLFRLGFSRGAQPAEVDLPLRGSFEFAGADFRLPGVLLTLQSWTRGAQIYSVAGRTVANTGLQPRGPYDALDDYEATEVLVPSHDGAQVPLSILHRRGLVPDGTHPTLLYGYASYGVTEEPWFSAWRLAWLEQGGVFAVANPRGSGAFGHDWYKAGFQASKPNTWKDFIATAEYLVRQGYTSPARLGIWGGSAGGILVGRAMTERPDLFAAVVGSVGVFDTVRAELTANGVPNIPEFGTHATPEGFRALHAMSTYDHIRRGERYPAVLLTHGVNDPRVNVWHSTKTAAQLLDATASGRPVLLRLDYASGHGIGNTREQINEERADVLAFLLWQLGVPQYQRREPQAPPR